MVEFNSARIIRETRQTKYYVALSSAEIEFVSKSTLLSDGEKLIWLNMANKSALDPSLSCLLTHNQIAEMVGKRPDTIYRSIRALRLHGFLEASYDKITHVTLFSLSLPNEGLEALILAPKRGGENKNPEQMYVHTARNPTPTGDLSDTLPEKNPDLLINNNINNKKHNHDAHVDFLAAKNPDVLDADALVCDFKNLIQEKYAHLPVFKRVQAALSHFSEAQKRAINERQLELTAITDGQKIQAVKAKVTRFNEELTQATPVPASRPQPKDCKLVEFNFDNEHFLVEEAVKNQILSQIPSLYGQNKILGEASKKPINTLVKEILFYVAKAGSKTLDACQLKRFHTARKLCLKGAWERPNGLMRQASIHREQQWQEAKVEENRAAKAFTQEYMQNVA